MKVVVTGATGFTGSQTVPLLLQSQCQVRCFVRPSSDLSALPLKEVELAYGTLESGPDLEKALEGADALVNIASLGFGHAPQIVQAALRARVKRVLFISTTAIFTQLNAPSKRLRLAAEELIQQSDLAYTILRPTMIYGSQRDRNMCRLIRFLRRWPVIPIFGSGEFLQQPVYVRDLAAGIAGALLSDKTARKCYNVPGADALTYNQVIQTICQLLQRKVRVIRLATQPTVACLKFLERFGLRLPIKAEQVLRLAEDKAFAFDDAKEDFQYRPRRFQDGIAAEIRELGCATSATSEPGAIRH